MDYSKYKVNIFYKFFFLLSVSNYKFEITLYPALTRERVADEIVHWAQF